MQKDLHGGNTESSIKSSNKIKRVKLDMYIYNHR